MRCEVLAPVGARLTEVAIDGLGDADIARMKALLAEHGVLIFGSQDLDDAAFVAFLRRFGPLAFTVGEQPVAGCADLNVVTNVGRAEPPRSTFHVDTSYVRQPPAYTALRAVRVPERGGATLFTNQLRAYRTLPAALRERLAGRTIRHVVTGLDLDDEAEAAADHPVFRPHPVSGSTALYLTAPARCAAISGLDETESRATITALVAHSTAEANTYRHEWSVGDVVVWDNSVVMHRADHTDVTGDRVLHRGMVATH